METHDQESAAAEGALAPGQRWSASRKRDVVLRLLRGESLDTVSREVGVELYRLEAWQAQALRSGPRNLDSGLSGISIVFQAAVPKPVVPKYTTSGVRRPSEL